jgi:chromosome segregation ATPase
LWLLYLSLDRTLSEAAELRRSRNPFGAEDRLNRADAMLTGEAISIPTAQATLGRMTLGGKQDRRYTLAETLDAMTTAFESARDTVLAAERGWAQAQGFARFRERIASVAAEARGLGYAAPAALAQAAEEVDKAELAVVEDPVGADVANGRIEALLAEADAGLAAARADMKAAREFLSQAEARLDALKTLRETAAKSRAERLEKVADPLPDAELPADAAPELRQWLETLAKTMRDGRPRATVRGAESWRAKAAESETEIAALMAKDVKVLDARRDMRGRLTALSALANARAAEGRLANDARESFNAARAALFGPAARLPDAARLLRLCEKI